MVDFNMPTTDRRGIPPARFTIQFTGTSSPRPALARVRYRMLHPAVFFVEGNVPTNEVFKSGVQLTRAGVSVARAVRVNSTVPIVTYFLEVRLEEVDPSGNVVSSKTRVMTIQ